MFCDVMGIIFFSNVGCVTPGVERWVYTGSSPVVDPWNRLRLTCIARTVTVVAGI